MASNIPTTIDLLTSGPSGIVSTIANGALGEVNNSLNERSTARQMINGIAGATALIATRVAPRIAPGIGNAITVIETLELINNLHVERVRNATSEQLEEMLEERNRIAMNGVM
jgi:phage-related protein